MKIKLSIMLVTAVLIALIANLGTLLMGDALARCPDGDLFCQGWSQADQIQKERLAFLDARIEQGRQRSWLHIDQCDAACVKNYDNAGHNALSALALKNQLPLDQTVKAYIVTWDMRGERADQLGKWNFNEVFATWLNDFADELQVNHPYIILNGDDMAYCVAEEYGGVCPGKY